ncbi:MAG: type VI secretion system contractile sheath large subunit [Myxococcales bacterium]|nr:type VI secretion system contractile sheath large subunit [Myxococcales bacterium]
MTATIDAEIVDTPLLDELLQETRIARSDADAYSLVERGAAELLDHLLAEDAPPRLDRALVDRLVEAIDERVSAQLRAILHAPELQHLESQWRGLRQLVDQIDFRENIRLDLISARKEELAADFDESPELPASGLYHHVYRAAFGTLGGKPYGVVTTTFEVGAGTDDLRLLGDLASLGAIAHVPILSNAGPRFFGLDAMPELARVKDLQAVFEGPAHARWASLRDREDARYLGLCLPRILLRAPYGRRESELGVRGFVFDEGVDGDHGRYLWGPASLALTARVAESFARYRWCPNIVGPLGGGAVSDLPLHVFEAGGELRVQSPCEVALDDRLEYELAEQGFIGLVFRKESDNAAFFSACSAQRPRRFADTDEGRAAQTNHLLGTRLPYMFVITRLAHYLKVLQREQIGSWKSRADLERELNQWIRAYVADMPDPSPLTRSRKPLKRAHISVEEIPGQVGWYRCGLTIEPHLKYEGAEFTLSLVGKLDRGQGS